MRIPPSMGKLKALSDLLAKEHLEGTITHERIQILWCDHSWCWLSAEEGEFRCQHGILWDANSQRPPSVARGLAKSRRPAERQFGGNLAQTGTKNVFALVIGASTMQELPKN